MTLYTHTPRAPRTPEQAAHAARTLRTQMTESTHQSTTDLQALQAQRDEAQRISDELNLLAATTSNTLRQITNTRRTITQLQSQTVVEEATQLLPYIKAKSPDRHLPRHPGRTRLRIAAEEVTRHAQQTRQKATHKDNA